ncbi:MAG: hypothetical protein J6V10_03810, partial [Clostridia bacterium]|nr:hypothetical protein [Clostridia bacterium]
IAHVAISSCVGSSTRLILLAESPMAPYYHVKACVFRTKATFCEAKLETEWKYTGFIARAANVKLRRFEVRKRFAPAKPETKRRHTRIRAKQAEANLS